MKARVLFITYENPDTRDAGDHIYSSQILDGLQDEVDRLDMIAYDTNGPLIPRGRGLTVAIPFHKKPAWRYVLTWRSGSVQNRFSKGFLSRLECLLEDENYTHILVNHTKMSFVLPRLARFYRGITERPRIVCLTHNAESALERNTSRNTRSLIWKLVRLVESTRARLVEKVYLGRADIVSSICDEDYEIHKNILPKADHKILRPITYNVCPQTDPELDRSVIISGSFLWRPKLENLVELLAGISFEKVQRTEHVIQVVGKMRETDRKQLSNTYPQVRFTGAVEEIAPYYRSAKYAIVPERQGGGFKLKILEALGNGCIVLCSSEAIRDRHLRDCPALVICPDLPDLATKLYELLDSSESAEDRLQEASIILQKFHSPQSLRHSLRELLA